MKLKVGAKYRLRCGYLAYITGKDDNYFEKTPFYGNIEQRGDNFQYRWMPDGRYTDLEKNNRFDIVEEIGYNGIIGFILNLFKRRDA